jgi:hypothetical protein
MIGNTQQKRFTHTTYLHDGREFVDARAAGLKGDCDEREPHEDHRLRVGHVFAVDKENEEAEQLAHTRYAVGSLK